MNNKTLARLKSNPHYKPAPGQYIPDEQDGETQGIKVFAENPKVHTEIPKHDPEPQHIAITKAVAKKKKKV